MSIKQKSSITVKSYPGMYVIVVGLVKERISEPDCLNGFIMDGFPRTVAQAKIFDGILSENGLKVDGVINLQANEEALTQRLSGRRTCDNCGATFHIDSMPSKQAGVCDYCGHALVQRNDDNPESIRIRLREYNKKTEPVIDFYQNANVLRNVDGERVPDDVFADVAKIIKECGCKAPALAVV